MIAKRGEKLIGSAEFYTSAFPIVFLVPNSLESWPKVPRELLEIYSFGQPAVECEFEEVPNHKLISILFIE